MRLHMAMGKCHVEVHRSSNEALELWRVWVRMWKNLQGFRVTVRKWRADVTSEAHWKFLSAKQYATHCILFSFHGLFSSCSLGDSWSLCFFFFESIMLVGSEAYVEHHRCVRSLCLPAFSFILAFIDLLPSTSLHQPSHSEPRLVMLWVALSNQPQYQYLPPTQESLMQSPPISPLSHPL